MSEINIKDIFDTNRVPTESIWSILCLILYAPLGLALVFLRLVIGVFLWLIGFVLPDTPWARQFLNHGYSLVLGIIVKIHPDSETRDTNSRIIIANSISALDHLALYKAAGAFTPSLWDLPMAVGNSLGLRRMDMSSKDVLIRNIKHCITSSKSCIAIQPEFSATNSRIALLKFNSWPFSIQKSVQPVVLRAWRPEILGVNLTSVSSTWWTDMFWFMFVPCTIFTIRYLKVKSNHDHEILAREVELDIAKVLDLRTSNYTVTDKFEYEKRYIIEATQRSRPRRLTNHGTVTIEMQRMVRQVRDVLPFVPGYVIQRDLLKTGNVDITVANLLDGIVTYTPEQRSPNTGTSSTSFDNVQSSSDDNTRENLSFEERKAKMIANAREKYMKKHGISDC